MFNPEMIRLLAQGIWETLYMTIVSSLLAYVLGLPLGILLILTDKNGIRPMRFLNGALGFIVNFVRSVPFLILLIAVIPFTRFLVGHQLEALQRLYRLCWRQHPLSPEW